MKAKKLMALTLTAALTMSMLLTGCGDTDSASGGTGGTQPAGDSTGETAADTETGKETVRILVPGLNEETTVDPISGLETKSRGEFEAFLNERIPDYNIELKTIAWDGWIQSVEAMNEAGEMDVGFFTNQEAIPDWYQDLTPYLEKDADLNFNNLEDLFIPSAVHYIRYKSFNHPADSGKVYGIPITIACNVILYDSKIFEDWGISEPTADMSMSDLIDLSEQMTGTNPVTGKQNYGAYLFNTWMEWYALSYDAVKPFFSDTMDINELDMAEYVDYIKDSSEVKNYFSDMVRAVGCSNPAVATGAGRENWLTEDNDIAINFDSNNSTGTYMKYVYSGDTSITDRYKALLIPTGKYGEGFPEFFRFSISKNAENADAAWEVIKVLTTDKEIVDFYLSNYASDKISCLNDTEGMEMMSYDINKERLAYQQKNVFITDDYWYWRTAIQNVNNQILSGEYDAEQAVEALHAGVTDWVNNIKLQSGN
jgi:ABC-type glycerol-3-phosphate transport system substrate-binding protein